MPFKSPYSREYRDEAVRLVHESSRPVTEIARDLGISPDTLATWLRRDALEKTPGMLGAEERTELAELRRRVRTLETERDILKKAAAFFARETDRTP
jgi:transposase